MFDDLFGEDQKETDFPQMRTVLVTRDNKVHYEDSLSRNLMESYMNSPQEWKGAYANDFDDMQADERLVFAAMEAGHVTNSHILISGQAGSGKSTLIGKLVSRMKKFNMNVGLSASTGVAAWNIGAMTFHKLIGFGGMFIKYKKQAVAEGRKGQELDIIADKIWTALVKRKSICGKWTYVPRHYYENMWGFLCDLDVIIVDEFSMIGALFWKTFSDVVSRIRKQHATNETLKAGDTWVHAQRNAKLYGGIKIISVGDHTQLPPIRAQHVIMSDMFKNTPCIRIGLARSFRQEEGSNFEAMLTEVRLGTFTTEKYKDYIEKQTVPESMVSKVVESLQKKGIHSLVLFPKRDKVEEYNLERLYEFMKKNGIEKPTVINPICGIQPAERLRKRNKKIPQSDKEFAVKRLKEHPDWIFDDREIPSIVLTICVGAIIMIRVNAQNGSYVNGTIGRITKIEKEVLHVDIGNTEVLVGKHTYCVRMSDTVEATLKQFPVQLSWAQSIHKAQGLELGAVFLDTNTFEKGQLYVGMSRVRQADRLFFINSICDSNLKFNPLTVDFETLKVPTRGRTESSDLKRKKSPITTSQSESKKSCHPK